MGECEVVRDITIPDRLGFWKL